MKRSLSKISVVLGATGMLAVGLGATATAASAATAPAWRTVLSVPNASHVSAVAATGPTSGWAFMQSGSTAYERAGATAWKKVTLPGISGAVKAGASSSSSVWAAGTATAGTGSELDRWNGKKWTEVRAFPASIYDLSVLGPNDVWVFGGGGVFHFNGRTWARVSATLQEGSALSDGSVWSFSGEQVDFYNGRKWTATSVASLFPAASVEHAPPFVSGIIALAPNNVYAVGEGWQTSAGGGPAVVLHFNGRSWSRVAAGSGVVGFGGSLAADGTGGVWIVSDTHQNEQELFRYSAGKLTLVTLPSAVAFSVSHILGTSKALVGGFFGADSVVLQQS